MIYPVLIDGEAGAYGVVFPDLPGCTAMGDTIQMALASAAGAASEWARVTEAHGETVPPARTMEELWKDAEVAAEIKDGSIPSFVTLIREAGRPVKANLSLDAGVLEAIDAAARRTGRTRSGMVETLAQVGLPLVG